MESINFLTFSPYAIDTLPHRGAKDECFCMLVFYQRIVHIFCKLSSSNYLFQLVRSTAIKEKVLLIKFIKPSFKIKDFKTILT